VTTALFQKDYWERKQLSKRRPPQHPVIKAYVLPKIKALRGILHIDKDTSLLDVGCGNGFFTFYFDQICKTCGVDFSDKMIALNPVKNTFCMDANHLDFKDNSFDIVFSHALLHHVKDEDAVIREMRRVSKKYVVFLEPNRNNPFMFLFSLIVREERKALRFFPSYLAGLAARNGLRVIGSFSFGMIVPNKTPECFLPFIGMFDKKIPLGMTVFTIAEK